MSDRIAVMHEGAISGLLDRAEFSELNVLRLAIGQAEHRWRPPDGARRNSAFCVLLLVVGGITAALNPRFLSGVNLLDMANLDRPVRHLLDRRRAGDHHRRHRSVGRLDVRAARRDLHRPAGQSRARLAAGAPDRSCSAGVRAGRAAGLAGDQGEAAALRRHALRPADLSRRRALLHRRCDDGLRLRRRFRLARLARLRAQLRRAAHASSC